MHKTRKLSPSDAARKPVAGLEQLPNLGPWSARLLACAGITTVAELRWLGAVAAFARARALDARVSLNLLWALEAALSGLFWQAVARKHRTSLLLALDEYQRRGGKAPGRGT